MKRFISAFIFLGLISPLASVQAATVQCATDPGDKQYMNITNATDGNRCLGSGVGNINGVEGGGDANSWDDFLTYNINDKNGENTISEGWLFGANYDYVTGVNGPSSEGDLRYNGSSVKLTSDFWATLNPLTSYAIGFKFGGANSPDNWFVYTLDFLQSSLNYNFFGKGDGLSHISIYGCTPSVATESSPAVMCGPPSEGEGDVPLPAAFWLFGSALLGFLGFSRKKSV
jgi:hypothetical protein